MSKTTHLELPITNINYNISHIQNRLIKPVKSDAIIVQNFLKWGQYGKILNHKEHVGGIKFNKT